MENKPPMPVTGTRIDTTSRRRFNAAGPAQATAFLLRTQSGATRGGNGTGLRLLKPVVIVLGANADRVETELNGLDVRIANNSNWETGMSSSIRAGIEAMLSRENDGESGEVDALIIMLCDQPLVDAKLLNRLVEVHQSTGAGIVAAEYEGTVGVPALFHRKYFPELAALTGNQGAKGIILRHAEDVERVPFPHGSLDVDTADDIQRLRASGS